jgi:hypothetical protein
LVVSVTALIFFAGFFTEREYGDVVGVAVERAVEGLLVPEEDTCTQRVCKPAGRYGLHCRQVRVPC